MQNDRDLFAAGAMHAMLMTREATQAQMDDAKRRAMAAMNKDADAALAFRAFEIADAMMAAKLAGEPELKVL